MKFCLTGAVILGISIILFAGCGDDPSSIGSEIIKGDRLNILEKDSFTDSLNQTSSYERSVPTLDASERILIGKHANVESSVLLKFVLSLTDSLKKDLQENRINVLSAEVILVQSYFFVDSLAQFDFSAHQITSRWSSNFNADSLGSLTFDPLDVSSNRNFINGDTLLFNIQNELVLSWLKAVSDPNTADDNGLYLKPSESTRKIAGFHSVNGEAATLPDLRVVVEKPGVYIDTLSFFPLYDITVVTGEIPVVSSENILVQNSLELQSKISFDLSSIPSAAIINYAELTLTLDTLESIRGSDYTKSVIALFLKDTVNNALNTSDFSILSGSGNQYKGAVTSFVQRWIAGTENMGLLITSRALGEGVELLAFKGSSSADASLRPRLKIVYTLN